MSIKMLNLRASKALGSHWVVSKTQESSLTNLFLKNMSIKISSGTVHKIPKDLEKVITSKPAILNAWEDITPLARNEWICWVTSPVKEETRRHRIERTGAELKEGKRRPCCWAGCIHR